MEFGGSQSFGYPAGKLQVDHRVTGEKMDDFGRQRGFSSKHVDYRPPLDDSGNPRKFVKMDKPVKPGNGFGSYFADPYAEQQAYRDSRESGVTRPQKGCNKENSIFQQRRTRSMFQSLELSMEEGEILLSRWEQNHFIDFNSWLQNAKCRVG